MKTTITLSFKLLIIFLLFFLIIQCNSKNNTDKKAIILISKKHSEETYSNRLKSFDSTVVLINMYELPSDSIDYYLNAASGIVLTGGEDVSPQKYGMETETERCGAIDLKRDSVEIRLIDYALKSNVPLLGVCRGEQILNVATGGSLFIDIPTDFGQKIIHRSKEKIAEHYVVLDKKSQLYSMCKIDSGLVNSSHHQAVNMLGKGLKASAHSPDSLIEAVEFSDSLKYNFVIAVQWHPERLDKNSKLSYPIFKKFLSAVEKYRKEKIKVMQ